MANLRVRYCLSRDEINMGVGMLAAGRSQPNVARALGVSQSVVLRMWNRYQTYGDVTHRHGVVVKEQQRRLKTGF